MLRQNLFRPFPGGIAPRNSLAPALRRPELSDVTLLLFRFSRQNRLPQRSQRQTLKFLPGLFRAEPQQNESADE